MALYTTIHLHNVPDDKLADYAAWFDGPHREALARLRGLTYAERFELTEAQLGDAYQPWRFMSVYDFDYVTPEIDLPALGPLLADARDSGLIKPDDSERIHSYRLYGDWKGSPNWQRDKPLSGISVLLGNYVAGRFEEYQTWYENVHSIEVANVPGHVAMKRGELSDEFVARALGQSPSGIAMEPRSSAGSLARTVHYFRKVSGSEFWPGGVAYAGDWSVYPDKG